MLYIWIYLVSIVFTIDAIRTSILIVKKLADFLAHNEKGQHSWLLGGSPNVSNAS